MWWLVCIFFCTYADNQAERAHMLYQTHAYELALQAYAQTGDTPQRWYNQGNCAYHMGDYTRALAYFLRACKNGLPWHTLQDCMYNIAVIDTALQKSNEAYFLFPWLLSVPMLLLQILLLGLLILLGVLVWSKRRVMIVCVLLACVLGVWGYRMYETYRMYGVVVEKSVSVYAGPGDSYPCIGELVLGDVITIADKQDTWYKGRHCHKALWVAVGAVEKV